jgi:very-short-patch-repair endonuclease
LNAYCLAVNTPVEQSHLTVHQLTGHLLDIYEQAGDVTLEKIPLEDIGTWNTARMKSAEAFAGRVQARLADIGLPNNLLFWGSKLQVLLPNEQEALLATLQQSITVTGNIQASAAGIAQQIPLDAPVDHEGCTSLAAVLKLVSLQPGLRDLDIQHEAWLLNQVDLEELLSTGKRLTELQEQYKDIFIPEAWEQPVMEIRQNLLAHGHKWYKFIIGDYNNSNKQLAAICKAGLPKDNAVKLQYVDAILENRRLDTALKEHEPLAKILFGKRWQKLRSNWQELIAATRYLFTVHNQVAAGICPTVILDYLQKHEDPAIAKKWHDELAEKINRHRNTTQQLVQQLLLDEGLRFGSKGLLHQPFAEQLSLLTAWQNKLVDIHQTIAWNNLVEMAVDEKLEPVTQVATTWQQGNRFLKAALQKTWYEYLLQQAIMRTPALRKFERTSHEAVVQQFRQLDKLNLQYNRARAALKHWENMPRVETAGGQVTILRTEFNKKARHKPIRKLIEEAGLAIQAIKPVFMMSPLSIANFLPPGVLEFDLVVFDEASQVKPVEALGAIMRGKQLVVVGDTKQLPPTSFFDSLTQEVEDEDNVTADLQSILGMCDAQGARQRMLRWHYRSRHESLIMLSNHEFYENRLVIFPSPGSTHHLGLVFHHLKDTIYDKGKTRTNPKEAEIVAEAIVAHARHHSKQSLGVVAFSSAQRQAIEDALEIKRRQHPDIEDFFKKHADEPFFIKNLENVQGDERDVIFISIGYGRTADGNVSMSFGPLNNDGGERRLNVLITRAKLRCEVFTNITADDIDTTRSKRYSIQALKSFLYFAQHGTLNMPEEDHAVQADNPFEENVARKLTGLGYTVRKQVGSSGFYIDMAIVDSAHPGRYIMGIECDGAAYHAARSARDRDRLRQQVLESIGWRIHRIWSTDWYRNPERELKRVVEAIEKAKELATIDDKADEEESPAFTAIQREAATTPVPAIPAYQLAAVPDGIATQEIHQHAVGQLSVWIEEIVKVESPVHVEEVARRLTEAAGVARAGNRIKDSLKTAIQYAEKNKWIRVDDEFLWHRDMQKPSLRDRSNLPAAARKLKYIAPGEMMVAVEKVVRESVAILPEDAVTFVARLFGFSRVTEDMKEDILQVIQKSIDQQIIRQEGDFLKLNK